MNPPTTKFRGDRIEDLAARWWVDRGARVLARNFRCRFGELDLVCELNEPGAPGSGRADRLLLVIVEVRGRAAGSWISGRESVTFPKRFRIQKATQVFLSRYQGTAQGVRFDVMDWNGTKLTHFPDAWSEGQ